MLRSISAFVLLAVDVFKLLLVVSVLHGTVEKLLYHLENIDPTSAYETRKSYKPFSM